MATGRICALKVMRTVDALHEHSNLARLHHRNIIAVDEARCVLQKLHARHTDDWHPLTLRLAAGMYWPTWPTPTCLARLCG